MKFTYYGHSCFLIETAGKKLLFDPFISGNPLVKDFDINSIQADYILVSHGHWDHTADMVAIAKHTGATIIAAAEITAWAEKQGCEKVNGMNFGTNTFEFGRVSFVPAWHSSSMPDGSYAGNPGGFVVKNDEGSFYYSGDTCLMLDMQLIPHYAQLSYAFLPIGGNFTMDVDDAIAAANFIKCDHIIGVHFDSWPVLEIDHEAAVEKFKKAGKTLILPKIGETINL